MILIDEPVTVGLLIFDELADDYKEMFAFDWDTVFAEACEPIEPWQWEWRSPLRALQQQLIGSSDVTGWTAGAASELATVLREPTTMHLSLLGFREAETGVGLLPAVSGDPDADTVSAAGEEKELLPLL